MTNDPTLSNGIEALPDDLIAEPPEWLRAVVSYDDEGVVPRYFRPDVESAGDDGSLDQKAAVFEDLIAGTDRDADGPAPFGGIVSQIRWYETAAVIHLPDDDGGGTVLTVDGDATDALAQLLDAAEPIDSP